MPAALPNDTLTPRGAQALADRIRNFWLAQGYSGIQTWVEQIPGIMYGQTCYIVRTNMVRGVPPGGKTEKP